MNYREFGSTGVRVSEVGFGAWGIGGNAYGATDENETAGALARAEELGCNLVDTAGVYGNSETILGRFLRGRRSRWVVSTKYSGQKEGIERTLEAQLQRLGTDAIDIYQIHWSPGRGEEHLYEALGRLKKAGKIRFAGVSLKTETDVDRALAQSVIDVLMIRFNLLEPTPFLSRRRLIGDRRCAVIVRSALAEGFLTGKYGPAAVFPDDNDQRHTWTRDRIRSTSRASEEFRFLEQDAGSMAVAAGRYPLAFSEVSSVVIGTRTRAQANVNFAAVTNASLSASSLERIELLQREIAARRTGRPLLARLRALFRG